MFSNESKWHFKETSLCPIFVCIVIIDESSYSNKTHWYSFLYWSWEL